jgi:hypothetical protein
LPSRSHLFLPQDPLTQGKPSPETPRAAVAPYQKRWGSSIHRWIGVVLSKHQNFTAGLPETLEKNDASPARRAHVMAGMYLKIKEKFPLDLR